VNVGANIGELTIGLSELGCRVIAIEPDPDTLKYLRVNLPPSVEILPIGLGKEDGHVTFYQKPEKADTSAIKQCGPAIPFLPVAASAEAQPPGAPSMGGPRQRARVRARHLPPDPRG